MSANIYPLQLPPCYSAKSESLTLYLRRTLMPGPARLGNCRQNDVNIYRKVVCMKELLMPQ